MTRTKKITVGVGPKKTLVGYTVRVPVETRTLEIKTFAYPGPRQPAEPYTVLVPIKRKTVKIKTFAYREPPPGKKRRTRS
jgi:hypothetical protein